MELWILQKSNTREDGDDEVLGGAIAGRADVVGGGNSNDHPNRSHNGQGDKVGDHV